MEGEDRDSTVRVLVYDGDCGFCTAIAERWREQHDGQLETRAENGVEAVRLEEPDGEVRSGADAVFALYGWSRVYDLVPAPLEAGYQWIAAHRAGISRLTQWLWGRDLRPARYRISRRAFLSVLGLAFLVAFASAWTQIEALVGPDGIRPAADLFAYLSDVEGARWRLPSVFWSGASDAALVRACAVGVFLSLALMIGVAQKAVLPALVVLYLSIINAGGVFFGYQWDILLVETGFFAIFYAGWWPIPRPNRPDRVSAGGRFLLKVLLFKLMFLSGAVKWLGADPTWRDLTALDYHHWTQPLPTVAGWWVAQLPTGFHELSTMGMYFIELVVPFFIFAPRRLRHVAALLLIALQVGIGLSGNYNFFGLLTIALCIPLFDDAVFRRKRRFQIVYPRLWRRVGFAVVALPFLVLSVVHIQSTLARTRDRCVAPTAGNVPRVLRETSSWHIVNTYGLFTCMTTSRPEITVEGSADGDEWRAYRFRYKANDALSRPRLVQPHQPRIDWQMWFSSLRGRCSTSDPWFLSFQAKLLEGHDGVAALLDHNPFPDAPPKYVRATVSLFEPAPPGEDAWWTTSPPREYCPVLELDENGQLQPIAR